MSNGERKGWPIGTFIWGAVIGAAGLAILGFTWGGWYTDSGATKFANAQAEAAVKAVAVSALAPMCVLNAKVDPDVGKLTTITALASSSERTNEVLKTAWATFADVELSTANQRAVADACSKLLFEKPA